MTPTATLRALSATERTETFVRLATEFYGTDRFKTKLATDLEKNVGTIFAWLRSDNVPLEVLITLESWIRSPDFMEKVAVDWGSIAPQLAAVSMGLSRVTATLGAIAHRMPRALSVANGGAAASSDASPNDDEIPQ